MLISHAMSQCNTTGSFNITCNVTIVTSHKALIKPMIKTYKNSPISFTSVESYYYQTLQ